MPNVNGQVNRVIEHRRDKQAQAERDRPLREVIVTDTDSGAQKAQKLARFDLIPAKPLWELAEHYGKGSKKYADRNWEGGYNWSLSYDALCRHLNQFWQGEDVDSETGSKHIIAVAWHAFALAEFMETHHEKDNRPNVSRTS